jgi:phospholipid-binding lipoprotein MlaA
VSTIASTWCCRFTLAAVSILCGCATTANDPRDPLQGFNRGVSAFNSALDSALIKPAAEAYTKVIPRPVRTGVNNFFGNLGDISVMVNNVLQGKFSNAASDFGRLTMNSTFGVLGLVDVASHLGIPKHDEDFGQTLGRWGVGTGPFIVLPIFGPTTTRDGLASIPDSLLNPTSYIKDDAARWSLFGLGIVSTRANLLKATNILDEAAIDKYTFTRDALLQRRLRQVYDGEVPAQLLKDNFEDFEDPEPDPPLTPPPAPEQPKQQ